MAEQVETMLESKDPNDISPPAVQSKNSMDDAFASVPNMNMPDLNSSSMQGIMQDTPFQDQPLNLGLDNFGLSGSDDFSWEMIGLGIEEPLPSQDIIDELYVHTLTVPTRVDFVDIPFTLRRYSHLCR